MALSAPPVNTPAFTVDPQGQPQWTPVWTRWLQEIQAESKANAAAAAAALAAAQSGGGGGGGGGGTGPPGPAGPAGAPGAIGPAGPAGAAGTNANQTVDVVMVGATNLPPPAIAAINELLVVFVTQSTPAAVLTWTGIAGSVFKHPPPIPLADGTLSVVIFVGRSDGNWYYVASMLGVHV